MSKQVSLFINERPCQVPEFVTVAGAVARTGQEIFRHSIEGKPRGPLCGMGICFECRVTVDGVPNVRSCQLAVRDGMRIETT